MATVIASNLTVFADASGHGNQSHLVYAANQGRWWLFIAKTKTATAVSAYVSSSADLTTATWSAGTDSPALPNAIALSANDQRNLGVAGFANGSTDVAHVFVGVGAASTKNVYLNHVRCTFTGASSITWESWAQSNLSSATLTAIHAVKGSALGVSSSGVVHAASNLGIDVTLGNGVDGDANARRSTNADTGATWTAGFGAYVSTDDNEVNDIDSFALAPLASAAMVLVNDNGGAAAPNSTGLRSNKYATGTAWPTNTGSADAGIGTTTQDKNDWCLCAVDAAHVYAFRRSGTNSFLCRMYGGSAWGSPASTVPTQNHKAGSGMFAATDGTDLYLFVLDSTGNNAVMYVKGSAANGTVSFGAWTQLEPAGSTARNYISGCPAAGNGQVGVVWTAVNGTNFDVLVSALSLAAADTLMGQACL